MKGRQQDRSPQDRLPGALQPHRDPGGGRERREGAGSADRHRRHPPRRRRHLRAARKADTHGVFQLEATLGKPDLMDMQPDPWRPGAANALSGPGPLEGGGGSLHQAQRGEEPITYMRPEMEPTWPKHRDHDLPGPGDADRQRVAGYTLGEADVLRAARARRTRSQMAHQRREVPWLVRRPRGGGGDRRCPLRPHRPLRGYGFNKAHAMCYALIGYQTDTSRPTIPWIHGGRC